MDDDRRISIPRDYFEKLVRRAGLHRHDPGYITVPRAEYDGLVREAQYYHALRNTLLNSGVDPLNLDILISTPADPEPKQQEQELLPPSEDPTWADAPVFVPSQSRAKLASTRNKAPIRCDVPPTPPSLSQDLHREQPGGNSGTEIEDQYEQQELYIDNHQDRSIIIRGLSQHTTLADIAKVVRGGAVLNMYMRTRDRSAHVAFVHPEAAESFVIHSKRSDIYIKGKRIEVFWDERQHFMAGHIARRIKHGATRNLVVRFVKPSMTPKTIREDLDHIHNLDVVDITMSNGHAFVSINGVSWAATAKSCMRSRLEYKGTKIEFYPDECAQPLPPLVRKPRQNISVKLEKVATVSDMNRYALLAEEGEEEFEAAHKVAGAGRRNVSA